MSDLATGVLIGAGVVLACFLLAFVVFAIRRRGRFVAFAGRLAGAVYHTRPVALLVAGMVLGATLHWLLFTDSYREVSVPKRIYLSATVFVTEKLPPTCDDLWGWLALSVGGPGTIDIDRFNMTVGEDWISVTCKE